MTKFSKDAAEIRTHIRNAEALSDELMAALATLKLKLLATRSHPELTPHVGQKAMIRLQRAEQSALASANDLFRTHDELSSLAVSMNVEHSPTAPSGIADVAQPVATDKVDS